MIRVMIVAPVPAVRLGLRALLADDPRIRIAGEATALSDPQSLAPETDVLVMAAGAVPRPVLERLLHGHEAQLALLLIASEASEARQIAGLPWRAWGLVPLEAGPEELSAAVQALHAGLLVGASRLMEPLLARPGLLSGEVLEPLNEPLTVRETEILQLLAQGLANKAIAASLHISEHTVKFHISSLYTKLGATNRTEAVSLGARQGLVVL